MLDHIPPAQAALFQHGRRGLLQAVFIFGGKLSNHSSMYWKSRNGVGCKKRQQKTGCHFETELSDASSDCAILHHCGCTKACRVNCKSANVARQDSGALFYVTVKVDASTMMCFRLLLLYSKPNWLLELAIS